MIWKINELGRLSWLLNNNFVELTDPKWIVSGFRDTDQKEQTSTFYQMVGTLKKLHQNWPNLITLDYTQFDFNISLRVNQEKIKRNMITITPTPKTANWILESEKIQVIWTPHTYFQFIAFQHNISHWPLLLL